MAAILDNAKTVYAAGPADAPTEPNKADIIRLFALVEGIIGSAVNGLVVGSAVVYQTRASLFANLARPADSLGIVYGDSTAAYNGVYVKAGASGTGSWTLTSLALPSTFAADLAAVIVAQAATASEVIAARQGSPSVGDRIAAVLNWSNEQDAGQNEFFNNRIDSVSSAQGATQSEITSARSGSATLVDRLNLILDTSLDQSDNVLNYLNGVIDAQATASQQRDTALGGRIDTVSASQGATQGEVTAARSGSANLTARLSLILDTALDQITGQATASQNRDNALGVRIDDEATARTVAQALRLPAVSRLLSSVYVAAFGNQVLFRRDGAVDIRQHHPAPLNQQFDTARTSPNGRFVEHIKPNGRAWFGPKEKRGLKAYAKTDGGSVSQVFLSASGRGEFQVTFGANNCIAPTIEGSVLTWLEVAGGIATEHEMPLVGTLNLSAGVTALNHIAVHGQSNSYGSANQPALSTTAPLPGRLKMLAAGQRSLGHHHNTGLNSVLPDQHIFPLADGFEATDAGSGESPATQLGYEFLSRRPTNEAVVTSCDGIGGQGMAALRRGTLPYANMLKAVAWLRAACWIEGTEYRLAGMYLDQGENGITATQAAKMAELTSFQSELTQDINAIRGGASEVLVALVQTSNFTKYNVTTSGVPLAQLQLAIDQPTKFLCVGPRYTEETVVDGVHMVNEGSAFMGALGGRVLADASNAGNATPLHVTGAVRSGTSVVVTFNRNVEINSSLVTDPGNSGVTWIDDTSSSTVSSVSAGPGASQVTVILSAVPTGANPKIGIAALGTSGANGGPSTGARSTIRDTSTDVSQRGRAMRRYASHQTPAVTI